MDLHNRLILIIGFLIFDLADAQTVTVAVASNFNSTLRAIVKIYAQESGHDIRISAASSGKLYAQIINGAPFDVLLSADAARPRRLEESGIAVNGSRFTYAIGRLVLWSGDSDLVADDCRSRLETLAFTRLAIANPETAPYGAAARQTLERLGVWQQANKRLVIGENISQALQFTVSGGATMGLVAGASVIDPRLPPAACTWQVPAELHQPIEQQAVLLRQAAGSEAASQFISFLRSDGARTLIEQHGYSVPD